MHAGPDAPDRPQRPGVRRLAGVPLLAACSPAELAQIAPVLATERVGAGTAVVEQGRVNERFWIVAEGEAAVTTGAVELARLGPGDHFGEIGLLDGDPARVTVTARTPMLLYVCSRPGFEHILATAPGARSRLNVDAGRRRLAHRVSQAAPLPPRPRVVASPRRSARRRALAFVGTPLALVLCAVAIWFVGQRNHTTTFGLDEALRTLRTAQPVPARDTTAGATSAPAAAPAARAVAGPSAIGGRPSIAPALAPPVASAAPATAPVEPFQVPAAGVYAYATDGSDAISVGSRHQYPATTYAVLEHDGGCGWSVDHHVVDQHVDHIGRCSRPGDMLRMTDGSRVTFFGQTDSLTYVCTPPVSMFGAAATCAASDGSKADYRAAIVDRPTVVVGGVSRSAVHVALDVTMTGRAHGTAHNELWFDAATGLILRQIRDVDTLAHAAFGNVRYTEHADFQLLSLTPQE